MIKIKGTEIYPDNSNSGSSNSTPDQCQKNWSTLKQQGRIQDFF